MSTPTPTPKPTPTLSLRPYLSAAAYLSLLLTSVVVFLPRSTAYLTSAAPVQRASADRPEPAFLTPLTASPAATAAWVAGGTAVVVGWWSGKMWAWWRDAGVVSGPPKTRDAIVATAGTAALLVPVLMALGAPLDSFFPHTVLLATTLALLVAYPVVYTLGIPSIHDAGIYDRYRLTKLVCGFRAENPLERALVYPIVGTLVGAWIGAAPLPLDWDRPWQSYPLTPLVGALAGFSTGQYASFARSALDVLRHDVADATAPAPAARKKGRKGRAH
ncbi:Glycosylphosphatidylinositol (GPI) anchor assembly protein [Cryptotrichosporon argae]